MYALQNSSEKNKSESSMNPWLRTEFLSFFFFFFLLPFSYIQTDLAILLSKFGFTVDITDLHPPL